MAKKKKKKAKKKATQRTRERCTNIGRMLGRAEGALLDAHDAMRQGERGCSDSALANAVDDLGTLLESGPDAQLNKVLKATVNLRKRARRKSPLHELAPGTLKIAEELRYIDPKGCK